MGPLESGSSSIASKLAEVDVLGFPASLGEATDSVCEPGDEIRVIVPVLRPSQITAGTGLWQTCVNCRTCEKTGVGIDCEDYNEWNSECVDRTAETENADASDTLEANWEQLQVVRAFSILSWLSALALATLTGLRTMGKYKAGKNYFVLLPLFSAVCAFIAVGVFNDITLDFGAGYILFVMGAMLLFL